MKLVAPHLVRKEGVFMAMKGSLIQFKIMDAILKSARTQ